MFPRQSKQRSDALVTQQFIEFGVPTNPQFDGERLVRTADVVRRVPISRKRLHFFVGVIGRPAKQGFARLTLLIVTQRLAIFDHPSVFVFPRAASKVNCNTCLV